MAEPCPACGEPMAPEHAHDRCPSCGWRSSCCEGSPLPAAPSTPRCPDGAGPLASSTWRRAWDRARTGAGLSQVHLHDLRHGGNTLAATLRYQHATSDRDLPSPALCPPWWSRRRWSRWLVDLARMWHGLRTPVRRGPPDPPDLR